MSENELGGWSEVLDQLIQGHHLSSTQAAQALAEVLDGKATSAQIAAFCTALRIKGETVDEMVGFREAMLARADIVALPESDDLIDTCGTGGDRSCSINVSTVAAIVAAGAGARVCKHGNRAATSACGSADVLEALGVAIDLDAGRVAQCITETGIGFCLAPRFHPAMRHAGPTRRELGIATMFNFLGPLANPARLRRQVVGVSDPSMADTMIGALVQGGAQRAMVVWGHDGLDELSTTTTSTIVELIDGQVRRYDVDPAALGLKSASPESLIGGDAATNAVLAQRILSGEKSPHRDIVTLNAAAALNVADIADGLEDGLVRAAASIDQGSAAEVLDRWVKVSKSMADGDRQGE